MDENQKQNFLQESFDKEHSKDPKHFWLWLAILILLALGFSVWAVYKEKFKDQSSNIKIEEQSDENIDTSDWQTYRNEEYGFELKYPKDFVLDSSSNYSIEIYKEDTDYGYEWPRFIITTTVNPNISELNREQYINAQELSVFNRTPDPAGFNVVRKGADDNMIYFNCYLYEGNEVNTCNQILSTFRFIE